jgi:tetraacyldisaccharide 4'-kinase
VDALNPFGGGEVFPMGRLREPVQALARADAIVITRSEASDLGLAIEREVRRWNPRAPIYPARVEPQWWVEHRTGRKIPLEEMKLERAAAFCGLGNPQSFYRTLEALGVRYVDCFEFEDHHRYLPTELMRITEQFRKGRDGASDDEKDGQSVRGR